VVQGQNLEVAERSFVDCEHKQEHEETISQQPFASIEIDNAFGVAAHEKSYNSQSRTAKATLAGNGNLN
jgi:hypothetical protein